MSTHVRLVFITGTPTLHKEGEQELVGETSRHKASEDWYVFAFLLSIDFFLM